MPETQNGGGGAWPGFGTSEPGLRAPVEPGDAPSPGDPVATGLRGFGPVGILAILVILAGNLMNRFGLTRRIFDFIECLVGALTAGLAQVTVLSSVVFAGISGSALADIASGTAHPANCRYSSTSCC